MLTPELQRRSLDTTLKTRPPDATHWSVRTLAGHLGVTRTLVHGVGQRFDVQPHRVERFKLSHDPKFEEKVRDVVGLYVDPPDRALVLCVDEKSQIQALDRTAPILPLRPGLPERQTHDYKRHGTTTLFAAFNILNGKVIGDCLPRHRGKEFIKFLNQLEKEVPQELDIHLILDNYSTHKSAAVQRWLKPRKRHRFHFHFTPTSGSLAQSSGALVGRTPDPDEGQFTTASTKIGAPLRTDIRRIQKNRNSCRSAVSPIGVRFCSEVLQTCKYEDGGPPVPLS